MAINFRVMANGIANVIVKRLVVQSASDRLPSNLSIGPSLW